MVEKRHDTVWNSLTAQDVCRLCGAPLGPDDDGLTKKLIDRGADRFLCTACLAGKLGTTPESLENIARMLRRRGCLLFRPWEEKEEADFIDTSGKSE